MGPAPLPVSGIAWLSSGNVTCTVSKAVAPKIMIIIIIMMKLDYPGKITLIRSLLQTCLGGKG